MAWKNSATRYGSVSIGLHWLVLLLIIAVYATMELRENYPKGSDLREALKTWHYMLGLTVFALTWARLIFRWIAPTPASDPTTPQLQRWLASAVHASLYLMMIVMPLLGWLALSADGKPIPFFGLQLPSLIAANKDSVETLEELHETIGNIGYFLIGLHAAAALYHHYIKHDNTLLRMLPTRK